MRRRPMSRRAQAIVVGVLTLIVVFIWHTSPWSCSSRNAWPRARMQLNESAHRVLDASGQHVYTYDRQMPLIFIGGVPRSGTTLMRAMLDAHPDVRCGAETRVIPRLLGMRAHWAHSRFERRRLAEAGVSPEVVDAAIGAFILEVVARHGEPAPRLCNKDPFALKSTLDLARIFPGARFVLMLRDGRAVAHSIISRHITISGFNIADYAACLRRWNAAVSTMNSQCDSVGPQRCLRVYYEQLVLQPSQTMRRVLAFLSLPWSEQVLHHELFVNQPGGISLSTVERSTDQVIRPINIDALTNWVDSVPNNVRRDIDSIAPMLAQLGYDSHAYPPVYGEPEKIVTDNTKHVHAHADYWRKRGLAAQHALQLDNNTTPAPPPPPVTD